MMLNPNMIDTRKPILQTWGANDGEASRVVRRPEDPDGPTLENPRDSLQWLIYHCLRYHLVSESTTPLWVPFLTLMSFILFIQ
jgi:hypothetical protein